MKKFDIIALGELNVDLLLNRIEGFPELGKEILASDMLLTLGSSTAIFAANAASLGSRVAFLGMIGKDNFGTLVKDTLNNRGVNTSYIVQVDSEATGVTVVMNYGNDRANVTYPGAMNLMGVKDVDPAVIATAGHVHISSVFLQETLQKDLYEIVKLIKSQGATVSIDTQWDPSEKWDLDYRKILPLVDVFLPNEQELKCLTGKDSLDDAIGQIEPYINVAVVKMGTNGSLLVTKQGQRKQMKAFLNTNVVDAIGAGDSFNAGFLTAYVKGKELEYCQYLGNLTGAVNTTAAGGTGAFVSKEKIVETANLNFAQQIEL
jgi:sugar/nucleoside kinase (ribokinase family)